MMRKNLLISTVSAIVLMSGTVLAEELIVDNWTDLKDAVENGNNGAPFIIKLAQDIVASEEDGTPITSYISGTVIDGNGYTISVPESSEGDFRFIDNSMTADTPLEIRNVTFKGGHLIGSSASGGAITNFGVNVEIGDVIGNFEDNYAKATGYAQGGAIHNHSTDSKAKIGDIIGNFKNNYATGAQAQGGAIMNGGTIGRENGGIWGDFIKNYVIGDTLARGGAISNSAEIGHITGSFKDNYASSASSASGGAIVNGGIIKSIAGDFENNHAEGLYSTAAGGAIYNTSSKGEIGNIKSAFRKNYAQGDSESSGGAIYNNNGKIGNIIGSMIDDRQVSFINNSAKVLNTSYSFAYGGAIYNNGGTVGNIEGSFENNYAEGHNSAQGGAIYNKGTNAKIGDIKGNFDGNSTQGPSTEGGAIYNDNGTIGDIKGNFSGNSGTYQGGAIYNSSGIIGKENGGIWGDFINNHVESKNSGASGGAIYNYNDGVIRNIEGNIRDNYAKGQEYVSGGAIDNDAIIGNIKGCIERNYAKSTNSAVEGGAIINRGMIGKIEGNIEKNYAESANSYAHGGVIYNIGTLSLKNSSFYDNYVLGNSGSKGGAIFHDGEGVLSIIADNGKSEFSGNKVKIRDESGNVTEKSEALFIGGNTVSEGNLTSVSLNSVNNGLIKFSDAIRGVSYAEKFVNDWAKGYTSSDGYGGHYSYWLQSNVILIYTGHLIKYGDKYWAPTTIEDQISGDALDETLARFESEGYDVIQDGQGNYIIRNKDSLGIYDGIYRIISEYSDDNGHGYSIEDGYIVPDEGPQSAQLMMTGDADSRIEFDNEIANIKIVSSAENASVSKGKYLNHNNTLELNGGTFTIKDLEQEKLRFEALTLNEGNLNVDSVMADLVAKDMGMIMANEASAGKGKINVNGILLITDSEEGDTIVQIPFADEQVKGYVNNNVTIATAPVYKYGVSYDAATGEFTFTRGEEVNSVKPEPAPDLFNQGVFASDVFMISSLNMQNSAVKEAVGMTPNSDYTKGRVWALPFYSDDTIEYKNFYDVDSRNYGLIAGVDTRAFGNSDLSHVYTLFGAYSEGKDKYEGIKVENKSWLLGLKASMFSDNGLYGDAIVDIASHDMDADTFYGSDSHDTYGYGAALKAGYKHDVPCDRWLYDAGVMLSWQQIKGDDFTAKSGAKMKTDDYSRLSLMPQVKVGYRALKYWTPYALVRYNFVLDEEGSSVANDTTLPEIESKDYVEYGLGVETTTNSNHSGFAHVLRHDGGREGWAITAGYRYNF